MADLKQFKLPDLGEGLTEGEIVRWMVSPGDTVTLNQPIVEVETAKAAVEVPSPYAGTVTELHHREGETVDVGTPIISIDVGGDGSLATEPVASAEVGEVPADEPVEPGLIGGPAPGGRTSVLVGYGPKSKEAKRRPRKAGATSVPAGQAPASGAVSRGRVSPEPAEPAEPAESLAAEPSEAERRQADRATRVSGAAVGANAEVAVLAKPPVRKRAKDLGVDLHAIEGSGPGGVITREDVEAAAAGGAAEPETELVTEQAAAQPAGARWAPGSEERLPIRGVRKRTAAAMVSSAFTAPHVTEFTTVDVTPMMDLVERLKGMPAFADVRVTPLLLVAKALLLAVRRHPMINSTWDEQAQEIVVKHYVNLGIAAATPRGLVVPNIKDADRMTLPELAAALGELTRIAREGRTPPGDMQHGTITITNVGVFGVDTGTPILNPGESAILCFGAVRDTPWVHEGQIQVRKVTQLGLSFDHRIVDGQLGSEFLSDVAAMLADPMAFIAYG